MTFRLRQKVACVVDKDFWADGIAQSRRIAGIDVKTPDKGEVYTIVGFETGAGVTYLELAEALPYGPFARLCFHSDGFRPLVEDGADISVFTAILDRVNRGNAAPAPAPARELVGHGEALR